MRRSILAIFLVMIFLASSITISNDVETNTKNEKVVASITYSSNERSSKTFALQPIVVITQPQGGAVVTDPHLVVLGHASDESGMNYWEWEWHWKGGSKSNSSYFETAEYVEFRIDIYGLHAGWNLIIARFKNIYGAMGEDRVNVTYNPPNSPPNKPTKPEGPTEGKVKETLHFNTVTTDPDEDSLEYLIDWGDGTNTGWLGPITSGTPFQNFHAWDEPGTYEVKAKARDIPYLEESEWSESLIVTISGNDTEPPVVIKKYPPNGATFTEPNITAWGYITDNVGVVSFGYTQEWEGGGTGSSWPLEEPATNYSFEIPITLHEGWNRIRIEASDAAGNYGYDEETVTYVVEDTIPPTTTKIVGEPKYGEMALYVTSHTPITLVAKDNEGGSGVNYTLYRIWYNGSWSDWLNYTESFTLEGEGPHYIEFYSVDNAGNIEEVHNNTHVVDDTAGVTYPIKYPSWQYWYVPRKWALICASDDEDYDYLADALYAYYTLKNHGYDDDHIVLILCHDTQKQVFRDLQLINLLNGPDGLKGTADDPEIDYNLPLGGGFTMKDTLIFGMIDIWLKMEENDEVLIYLADHGSIDNAHNTYFCFEDRSAISEKEFATWINTLFAECHKVVIVGDFCFSGCFLDTVNSCPRNVNSKITNVPPPKILISSTGNPPCEEDECYCCLAYSYPKVFEITWRGIWPVIKFLPFAGLFFSHYFWGAINAGMTYWGAFNLARNSVIAGQGVTVKAMQDPRYKSPGLGRWENITNSPTQPEYTDMDGMLAFYSEDYGGISCIDVNITVEEGKVIVNKCVCIGNPVGVKATYYRIWHNGGWTPWKEFAENITFEEEGKYYVECYSEDYLGNKEDVINHTIYVDNSPPDITPTPSYPPDGGETDNVPKFSWSTSEDPSDVSYTLQVATDESFVNIVFQEENISCPHYTMNSEDALEKGTYYWRVKASDGLGHSGDWSTSWSFTVVRDNSPPEKPSRPSGPNRVEVGVEYNFSITISDVDGDEMIVWFDWGDGTYDLAFGYYKSGDTVTMSHSWEEKGTYSVRVKTVDIHGAESEWSDPLPITVPYSMNVSIEEPEQDYLYIFGKKIIPLRGTLIIGPVKIEANANGEANKVEFYVDDELKQTDAAPPYSWLWDEFAVGRHTVRVVAHDKAGNIASDEQVIRIFNL